MKDLALFSALSPAERQQVALMAGKKIYQKGEMIFYDGDPADTNWSRVLSALAPEVISSG